MPRCIAVLWRAAAALPFLMLFASLPTVSQARPGPHAPKVDLTRIRVHADSATAPLGDGHHATLTIDATLQRAAERLLRRAAPAAGAIILIRARSGHVLVWAEHGRSPSGDVLLHFEAPSASVFKIVTTTALLEHAHVSPDRRVCYVGAEHAIERRNLFPPRRDAHCARFFQALGHSINAVFARLATRFLRPDDLKATGDRFGFNRPLPFDARVPLGSLDVPSEDLAFARASAGFVGSALSPLGAAYLAYVVAAGGDEIRTHIVAAAPGYRVSAAREVVSRVMRRATAFELRRMMEVTVQSGTSFRAFRTAAGRSYLPGIRVAGKTGTLRRTRTSPTTSWFTGFAPSRNPEVVVSVLLENGRIWRRKANQVARDMLRIYFAHHGRHPGVTDPFATSP